MIIPSKLQGIMRSSAKIASFAFAVNAMNFLPQAQAAVQVPPEVEVQAQALEDRFNAVLAEECTGSLCSAVGCEILGFRTLDEKQNSSLPGLDMSDEDEVGPLQFKLSSLRCEFAYESTLAPEAVTALRQRLGAKIRQGGVTLAIQGRKLNAASPALKAAGAAKPDTGASAPTPPTNGFWSSLAPALPNALLILMGTLGLLAVIWGFRRLGKPRPVVVTPAIETPENQAASSDEEGPSAFTIMNKREQLKSLLASDAALAENALGSLAAKSEIQDLCRVLQHFGPEPLAALAQKAEYKDLFVEVRKRYEAEAPQESNATVGEFLDKVERLVALAQLGRPESSLSDELGFVKDLAPDEFAQLVSGLSGDELMAILSFVPANLRAQFLQGCSDAFVESYVQHVLRHPRVSDHLVRRIARQMREQYAARFSEIKNVTRAQLPVVEQLLNSLRGEKRDRLIQRLRTEQPVVFEKLISETLLDRALVAVPEKTLNDVFLLLTPEEAAAYLDVHPDRAAILAKLKAPLAASIRNRSRLGRGNFGLDLEFVENELPEAQDARLKLNEAMKQKSAMGEVNLRRLNETVVAAV